MKESQKYNHSKGCIDDASNLATMLANCALANCALAKVELFDFTRLGPPNEFGSIFTKAPDAPQFKVQNSKFLHWETH